MFKVYLNNYFKVQKVNEIRDRFKKQNVTFPD
jgi:hypothetical protein